MKRTLLPLVLLLATLTSCGGPKVFYPGTLLPAIYEANEVADIPAEYAATARTPLQRTHSGFPTGGLQLPDVYTEDFNPKNSCRYEYNFTGGAILSQLLQTHITIHQAPGTPGGTTATAETVDTDFALVTFRVISNHEVQLQEMQDAARPPVGWFLATWSKDPRFRPQAYITYQNCLEDNQTSKNNRKF